MTLMPTLAASISDEDTPRSTYSASIVAASFEEMISPTSQRSVTSPQQTTMVPSYQPMITLDEQAPSQEIASLSSGQVIFPSTQQITSTSQGQIYLPNPPSATLQSSLVHDPPSSLSPAATIPLEATTIASSSRIIEATSSNRAGQQTTSAKLISSTDKVIFLQVYLTFKNIAKLVPTWSRMLDLQ